MSARPPASSDLQERTLKVTNIPEEVTKDLLYELFLQCGPVKNVVLKPDFAFIEFDHKISVGYALALMDGVTLFGEKLELQPKLTNDPANYIYLKQLKEYEALYAANPRNWWNRFGKPDEPLPPHLCRAAPNCQQDLTATPMFQSYFSPSPWVNDANTRPSNGGGRSSSPGRRERNNRHRDYQDEPNMHHHHSPDHFRSRGGRGLPNRPQNHQRDHPNDRRYSQSVDRRSNDRRSSGRGSNHHSRR